MKIFCCLFLAFLLFSCQQTQEEKETAKAPVWKPYNQAEQIAGNSENESVRLRFKLIQSKVSDRNALLQTAFSQLDGFSETDYKALKSLILEQDIPTIQSNIKSGKLNYENLTKWYLYRIVKFESDSLKSLNNLISINPKAVEEAKNRDKKKSDVNHPIFGMPILLKDNVNTKGMKTTAGAVALQNNQTSDAFIVERVKAKGGIILGKANLSEWANFLCQACPNGYSAVGGQTLNPYGARKIDTGGSSAGSGSVIAANYAVAAVGTETAGSILSPASQNSVVGLKPTVGLLSRGGIVPISGTLDTPGPMTRNVIDNAILLSALSGTDPKDLASKNNPTDKNYLVGLEEASLEGIRFGVNKNHLEDSIYKATVAKIAELGGIGIEFQPEEMNFEGFLTLLNADMHKDLPSYLKNYASPKVEFKTVAEIIAFNKQDTSIRIPYGQARFDGVVADSTSEEDLATLINRLKADGKAFFDKPMADNELDFVLSINNWDAAQAAVAKYPALTIPMGYRTTGEPVGLTLIAKPFEEDKLLRIGYAFEKGTKSRKMPEGYK
jgi:amidase